MNEVWTSTRFRDVLVSLRGSFSFLRDRDFFPSCPFWCACINRTENGNKAASKSEMDSIAVKNWQWRTRKITNYTPRHEGFWLVSTNDAFLTEPKTDMSTGKYRMHNTEFVNEFLKFLAKIRFLQTDDRVVSELMPCDERETKIEERIYCHSMAVCERN